MRRPSAVAATAVVLSLAIAAPCLASRTDVCPASSVRLGPASPSPIEAARVDSSSSVGGTYHVAFDLTAGTVAMDQCCAVSRTYTQATDAFDVTGVAAGTPVAVLARFVVDSDVYSLGCGDPNCGGLVGMSITHGSDVTQQEHVLGSTPASQSYHDVLQLPVTIVAGSPETISFSIYGSRLPAGNHGSDGTGAISFGGLPPGAGITSCWGMREAPTPTQRATWGQLKVLYH